MAGRKHWTREMMVSCLRGPTPPRVADFRKATPHTPSYLTILREFGTWEAALHEAGHKGYGGRGRRPKPRIAVTP